MGVMPARRERLMLAVSVMVAQAELTLIAETDPLGIEAARDDLEEWRLLLRELEEETEN